MVAKSKAAQALAIPSNPGGYAYPEHQPLYLLLKGTEAHDAYRIGAVIDTTTDNTKRQAIVATVQVGSLIDLITQYGSQMFESYARPFSAKGLVQAIGDAEGVDVVDVTKLYTAVGLTLLPATEVETPAA